LARTSGLALLKQGQPILSTPARAPPACGRRQTDIERARELAQDPRPLEDKQRELLKVGCGLLLGTLTWMGLGMQTARERRKGARDPGQSISEI